MFLYPMPYPKLFSIYGTYNNPTETFTGAGGP